MIPYLEQLTGEKWILLKDKDRFASLLSPVVENLIAKRCKPFYQLFFRWPDKKSENGGVKDGVPVHQDIIVYDFDQVCLTRGIKISKTQVLNPAPIFRNMDLVKLLQLLFPSIHSRLTMDAPMLR